jgi:hypothetical protein
MFADKDYTFLCDRNKLACFVNKTIKVATKSNVSRLGLTHFRCDINKLEHFVNKTIKVAA